VSYLGTLRRDRDWDLPQEAVQAVANVFLIMAEVGHPESLAKEAAAPRSPR